MLKQKLTLGTTIITKEAWEKVHPPDLEQALARHAQGDWGDSCQEEREYNELALHNRGCVYSKHRDRRGTTFLIVTGRGWGLTTVSLAEDE